MSKEKVCVPEQLLNSFHALHEELIKWVVRAQCLHANDLATNFSIELEAHCHLAAPRERAVFPQKNDVEDPLILVVRDLQIQLFVSHL